MDEELKFIKEKHEDDKKVAEHTGITLTLEDYEYVIQQAERARILEADLKETITKKNRFLRQKDKKIKNLEWDNLVHRNGHGRLYAEHYSLIKKLEEKGINI